MTQRPEEQEQRPGDQESERLQEELARALELGLLLGGGSGGSCCFSAGTSGSTAGEVGEPGTSMTASAPTVPAMAAPAAAPRTMPGAVDTATPGKVVSHMGLHPPGGRLGLRLREIQLRGHVVIPKLPRVRDFPLILVQLLTGRF